MCNNVQNGFKDEKFSKHLMPKSFRAKPGNRQGWDWGGSDPASEAHAPRKPRLSRKVPPPHAKPRLPQSSAGICVPGFDAGIPFV